MKKFRVLKLILIFIGLIVVFMVTINVIPPKKVENNPFIATNGVMLAAHRGGATQNPENTMKAYKSAVEEYQADVLETDLYMTKDGHLVLHHNSYLNSTTDIELFEENYDSSKKYYIKDYTLEQLQNLNFGYKFKYNNERPYKDLVSKDDPNRKETIYNNDLAITELYDFFDYFYKNHKDLLFIIEIKNSGQAGFDAADIINDVLTNSFPDYKNRVVIGTFNNEIESYLKNNYPDLFRGASPDVATQFVATQLLKVNLFDNSSVACLQLPMEEMGLDLTLKTYIRRAHRRNIAVQYWTINDEDDMKYLISQGADCIMSDDIALLRKVLNEQK